MLFFIKPLTKFIIKDNKILPPSSRRPEIISNSPHLHMKPTTNLNYRNTPKKKQSWKWLQVVNRTQNRKSTQPGFFSYKTFKLWSNVKSGLLSIFGKGKKNAKEERGNRGIALLFKFLIGTKDKILLSIHAGKWKPKKKIFLINFFLFWTERFELPFLILYKWKIIQ